MVEILHMVLFARLSLLARTEGQIVAQHTERNFCIILYILFTLKDVKGRSLTQVWKNQINFHAILVPVLFKVLRVLFSSWSEL